MHDTGVIRLVEHTIYDASNTTLAIRFQSVLLCISRS
jgi:hypothetical protein